MMLRWCLLLALLPLAACSILPSGSEQRVNLGADYAYVLQPVPASLPVMGELQHIVATASQKTQQLLLQTEWHNQRVELVGLSLNGMVLLQASWQNGSGLQEQVNLTQAQLPADILFAYMQLSSWPPASVRMGLRGVRLQVRNQGETQVREFWQGETLVFSLTKQQGCTYLVHYQQQFTISIKDVK